MLGIRSDPKKLAGAVAKEAVSDANLKTASWLPNTRENQESFFIVADKICRDRNRWRKDRDLAID